MPNMANITVKDSDGTTDILYTAMSASAGDGVPARWRVEDTAVPAAFRAWLEVKTVANGPKTARRMEVKGAYPYALDVSGVPTLISSAPFSLSITLPQNLPQSEIDKAVARQLNAIASALVQSSAKTGYAPT